MCPKALTFYLTYILDMLLWIHEKKKNIYIYICVIPTSPPTLAEGNATCGLGYESRSLVCGADACASVVVASASWQSQGANLKKHQPWLGGGNSNIFYFHPYLGKMIQFD